ncbi:MAG: spore coat associated protein CotJA [Peptostreptococcaceae bacterium]
MDNKYKNTSKESNLSLARPYVNDQTFTKMYSLSGALEHGTLFPELYLLDSLMYNKELYSTPKKRSGGRK